ncbi:MAG: TetR/AcrR family transcriptional regulator [Firmicutes bacterium]|nr:TetR/AcrR family transcriptional regulator [Bacillota bacterium]
MPSQTFFNLQITKQNKILEAAKKEFSKVPFAEASINQIIKEANISRGSFYMYFENKYDLISYILEFFRITLRNYMLKIIPSVDGDLEKITLEIHDYFYHLYEDKENQNFIKNIIIYFHSNMENNNSNCIHQQPIKDELQMMIPYLNPNQFYFTDENKIKSVVDIVFSVLKTVLYNAMLVSETVELSRKRLKEYLSIIKIGYTKKEEEMN